MWIEDLTQRQGIAKIDTFYNSIGSAITDSIFTWKKPFGAKYVYILCLSAGGGGARVANDATTRGGGAGGSGGITTALIPCCNIPDVLYIKPGQGGLGATSPNTSGSAGGISYIGTHPNFSPVSSLLFSASGAGGGTPTASSGGSPSASFYKYSGLGVCISNIGDAGTNGGASANASGTNKTSFSVGTFTTGGTGGGNGTGSGGSISGGMYKTLAGGVGTTGGNGNIGTITEELMLIAASSSIGNELPYLYSGGTGGGGHSTGQAGHGGNASYGGGGGGGGGCSAAGGISGNGGNGGSALIIIASF